MPIRWLMKIKIILILIAIMASLLVPFLKIIFDREVEVVNWVIRSNPSEGDDYANAICGVGDYIYVVGVENDTRGNLRIEKRKIDGELVTTWTYNNEGLGYADCIAVDDKIYIIGYSWIVLVLDLDLNLIECVKSNTYSRQAKAYAILSDGKYLYIVGYDEGNSLLDRMWRIEKRILNNLSLVDVYVSNPSDLDDVTYGVGINPVTGNLWVIGFDWIDDLQKWRIEVLDRESLKLIKIIRLELSPLFIFDGPFSISFDDEGNAIIVGSGGIVKVNENGNVIALNTGYYEHFKSLYLGSYIYVVGKEYDNFFSIPIFQKWFWYLYVYNSNLSLINKITLGLTDVSFLRGKFHVEGSNIYVAGSAKNHQEPFDWEWTIYSIDFEKALVPSFKMQFHSLRLILFILEVGAGAFLGSIVGMMVAEIDFLRTIRTILCSAISATFAHLVKLRIPLFAGLPLGFIALLISLLFFSSPEDRRISFIGALVGSFMFIGASDTKRIEGAIIGVTTALLLKRFLEIITKMRSCTLRESRVFFTFCSTVVVVIAIIILETVLSEYIGTLFVDMFASRLREFLLAFTITLVITPMEIKR